PCFHQRAGVLHQPPFFCCKAGLRISVDAAMCGNSDMTSTILSGVNPLQEMLAEHPQLRIIQMLATMVGDGCVNAGR
ncbi:hypothetical protein AAY51_23690, partial [Vibrio parahaemolyticus]